MGRSHRTASAWAAALVLALVGFGAVGCGKKLPLNPADWRLLTYPEGHRDSLGQTPSDLVVWPDQPIPFLEAFRGDTNLFFAYRTGEGTLQGAIFDDVGATGYQMFRREVGGFRGFEDFAHSPTKRWADRHYYGAAGATLVRPPAQLYQFADATPPAVDPYGYVGRAVFGELSGGFSPLTNLGQVRSTSTIGDLPTRVFMVVRPAPAPPAPPDSLLDISWDPVPGAWGYWLHLYSDDPRSDIRSWEDFVASGLPSPIAIAKVSDLFVGFIPAPLTRFKLGDPVPTGGRVFVYRIVVANQRVLIRVSAVDRDGRLLATTGLAGDALGEFSERFGQETRLRVFPAGAIIAVPSRPGLAQTSSAEEPALGTGVPRIRYIQDGEDLPRLARLRTRPPR